MFHFYIILPIIQKKTFSIHFLNGQWKNFRLSIDKSSVEICAGTKTISRILLWYCNSFISQAEYRGGGGASLEIFSMPYCNCVLIHIGLHVHVIYSVLQSDNGLKIFFGWFELWKMKLFV